jgi:hypothetical protein
MNTPVCATLAKLVFKLARPLYQAQTAAAIDAVVNTGSDSSDDE